MCMYMYVYLQVRTVHTHIHAGVLDESYAVTQLVSCRTLIFTGVYCTLVYSHMDVYMYILYMQVLDGSLAVTTDRVGGLYVSTCRCVLYTTITNMSRVCRSICV